MDVISTSESCSDYFEQTVATLNHLNRSSYSEAISQDLFQEYIKLRKGGLTEIVIEQILNLYCQAKRHLPQAINSWIPPSFLNGNYTGDLTGDSPYNDDYHLAKNKGDVFMAAYRTHKNNKLAEKLKTSTDFPYKSDLLKFYRLSACIVLLSLALSLQNVLRIFYENQEEDDDDEDYDDEEEDQGNGGYGFYAEIYLCVVFGLSLITILILIKELEKILFLIYMSLLFRKIYLPRR
ncbi:DUF1073 domain-containing protein [Caenorhabditis elegans]|uniref:DUF1073 domain-containing protein n=1 Tax=Caenorhabditis elegans TaxID=6239 RepID=O01827_CAEEL|nr:DUF1073 domain-containing protein [Caenorhabditis elegans]CCD68121.1 DUF1073 domain-containing protein [Caenorhabditis elegans]|eukprot:NP_490998.2 Uncharacterized protein CELE_C55C2.4 [Caenorhabditis elegans]